MNNKKMPIGYWVRQVDQLLTEGVDKVQSQFGLTRSDWLILNSLAEQSQMEREKLLTLMKPFMDEHITWGFVQV